jgi:hypothetical protein
LIESQACTVTLERQPSNRFGHPAPSGVIRANENDLADHRILGVVSLRAVAARETNDELLCEFSGVIRDAARLEHEIYGQDAALVFAAGELVAIQFKYSWDSTTPVDKSELHKILDAFDRSECELPSGNSFSRFIVLTNRQLSPDVREILADNRFSAAAISALRSLV